MGFNDIKRQVIQCLLEGTILHEQRGNIDVKNLLALGEVTIPEVTEILKCARGDEHSCSPHHFDRGVDVHVIKTVKQNKNWYIKWYFIEPNCIFISVHESEV